jgi:Flp pilus assembly protein TadG
MIGHGLLARTASSWAGSWARFWRNERRGIATIELAICLPVLLVAGGYGVELANYSIVSLRVSQIALNLADNGSRVGAMTSQSVVQLREADINDIFDAVQLQGQSIGLTSYGRVTVSSLENVQQSYDLVALQRIHWQRCIGLRSGTNYDSGYGTTKTTDGTTADSSTAGTLAPLGIGDTGYKVNAPISSALIFVEINYDYQPLFGSMFLGTKRIHSIASLIVRDRRDFAMLYNPSPAATRMTCNKYTT